MTILSTNITPLPLLKQIKQGSFTGLANWLQVSMGQAQRCREVQDLDTYQLRNLYHRSGGSVFCKFLRALDSETQKFVICRLRQTQVLELLAERELHERRDLLQLLEPGKVSVLLDKLSLAEAAALRALMVWPQGSAAAAMDSGLYMFSEETTVAEMSEALAKAKIGETTELYILRGDGTCRGKLAYRQLLGAEPSTPVRELVNTRVLLIPALLSAEVAARDLLDSEEATAPIVHEGRLMGLMSMERAQDILRKAVEEEPSGTVPVAFERKNRRIARRSRSFRPSL